MEKLKVVVVLGSVREGRQGPKAMKFIERHLKEREWDVTLIDAKEYDLPILKKMYKSYDKGEAPEKLEKLAKIFKNTDAIVVVSAEYNNSIPPGLSNTLDHFLEEYFFKPSAIVCYSAGGFGGVRAAMQLRMMLSEMGMPSIPSLFPISNIEESLNSKGIPKEQKMDDRVEKFLDELEWYTKALKNAREKETPY